MTSSSSRIIIKNLPSYLDDGRLRTHFGVTGTGASSSMALAVTDARVVRKPDGTSRRFGFVGYRSASEAEAAVRYFDRTFVDTARVQVGLARGVGEAAAAARQDERGAMGKGAFKEMDGVRREDKDKGQTAAAETAREKKERKKRSGGVSFDEFMAVMAPRAKRKAWQNEEGNEGDDANLKAEDMAQQEKDDKPKKKKQKKQQQKDVEKAQEKGQDEEEEMETKQDEVLDDEGVTDLEYMYKRMRRRIADDDEDKVQEKKFEQSGSEAGSNAGDDGNAGEDDEEEGEEEEDEKTKRARERERAALEEKARKDEAAVDSIMTTGRLFVRNLPFSAKEEELEAYFSRYGDVSQTHITVDKATKQSKGIAFVTFSEPSHALAAFRASDGSTFQGRLLHVLPAVDARPRPEDDSKKTLKQKKQEQVKAGAQRDFNWSTLFMSADAVASSVADRLGIDKSDIVNPDEANSSSSVSPAVRLALAETRVIQETREYLEEQGIDVTSFSANEKAKRSDTTILVKNMPFGTSVEQLQGLFEPHGSVSRVVMPPAGTMAIVEMDVPNEARVAFRALAYKRMGNSLLYLEKAPVGLVKDRPEQSRATEEQEKEGIAAPPPKASGASSLLASSSSKGQGGAGAGEEEEAAATLFIKNLSFSTTDTRLASMFSHLDGFAFARIQTKQAASNGARISMGYGFVGFRTQEQAKVAQKSTNGKTLDGHQLAVAFARRGHDADDRRPGQATAPGAGNSNSSSSSGGGTKLIIKNLPFETSKKDLRALFAPHGTLKSVRVPRKAAAAGGGVGGARGFGFVEFGTRREAKDAMEALRYTHLLGRRLVVGWDDEAAGGVEVLREKARREQGGSGSARAAKTKLRLGAEDIKEAAKRERKAREDAEDDDVDDDQ